MSARACFFSVVFLALLIGPCGCSGKSDNDAPPPAAGPQDPPGAKANGATGAEALAALKYRFGQGKTYVYSVRIVAEIEDTTETSKGQIQFAVRSNDGNEIRLTPTVNLPKQIKRKNAGFPGFVPPELPPIPPLPPIGSPFLTGGRELTITPQGRVVSSSGETALPYLLGDASRLVIEPLSPQGQKRWEQATDVTIREIHKLFPFARFGPRSERDFAAKEVATYELADSKDGVVPIRKKFELKTVAQVDEAPRVHLHGSGELAFDERSGMLKSGEFKATLLLSEKNVTVRVPITVSYSLLDAAKAAALTKEDQERAAKALEAAKLAAMPKEISDTELTRVLAELKSKESFKIGFAADRLAKSIPVEGRREEVAGQLEELLKQGDGFLRSRVAKALKLWGTAKNVPAVIALLKDENMLARHAALEALGAIPDPKGAAAAAESLADFRVRMQASAALKSMGAVAEKPVIGLVKHQEWATRMEACKILADIGTKESLPALKEAAIDSNRLVAMEAEKAIKSVERRSK